MGPTTITEYEVSFINLVEYSPHLVTTNVVRARRFENGLRYMSKRVIRPLILPDVWEESSRECWRNKIDNICFHYNKVGHIKRNCSRLRTRAIVPRGGKRGENARPGENRLGNKGNKAATEMTKNKDEFLHLYQVMRGIMKSWL